MTPAELQSLKTTQEEIVSKRCAALVASEYQGKPCMGTSIHARAPGFDNPYEVFLFDHTFMKKFHLAQTSSEGKLDMCAGSFHFLYQQNVFKEHYILYDGSVEGIRNACEISGTQCLFHSKFDNNLIIT